MKSSLETTRRRAVIAAYWCGLVGLMIMVVVCFWMAIAVVDMSTTVWGFSGLYSFGAAFLIGPLWIAMAIICFVNSKKALDSYRTDLTVMGILNLVGVGVVAFYPLWGKLILLVSVIYFGVIFGWVLYRALKRKGVFRNWTKTTKAVSVVIVVVVVAGIAVFAAIYSSDSAFVRRQWKKTALANTSQYEVLEEEYNADDRALILTVRGVDMPIKYSCGKDRICHYAPELDSYFWQKNRKVINQVIAKYDDLDQWSEGQIYVYGGGAVIDGFVRELLQISDIRKLYEAYKEEARRTTRTNAMTEFGSFFLDVQGREKKRIVIFERAEELRL